ncbi:MAG: YbhB/YbcL family Raf kinase inhibitor-like protein [Nitrospirae bacterium]|nr:YbhB/YbcL family Raf kinase inhibitor-like protein [Nitrospirota bacterium]
MRAQSLASIITVVFLSLITFVKEGAAMSDFMLSSTAFQNNGSIPSKYTCDGSDINPPLAIENIPSGTKSLALIVDDPDAPMGTWVHWLVWNIAPNTNVIKENDVPKGALLGLNDFRKQPYGGPCPPSGTHRYFFKLYALDTTLGLPAGAKKADIEKAMKGHVLAQTQIIGLYKRSGR